MEDMGMTDRQLRVMLEMIIEIIKKSETQEEAIKRIEEIKNNLPSK